MKRAVSLFALFASTAFAGESILLPIMVREGETLVQREAEMKDLTSKDGFEGEVFKVVLGEGSTPICLTATVGNCAEASERVRLRAATSYYHMTKAREWFLSQPTFQAEPFRTSLQEKVTIRVNQELPFSPAIHFETTGREVNNGARTIGPSREWEKDDDTAAWGYETWFYTPEKKKNNATGNMIGSMVNNPNFKDPIRDNMLYGDFLDLSRDVMDGQVDPMTHLISAVFTLGTVEVLPGLIAGLGKLLKQTELLDAALIPEISYHEYTHTALAPVFNTLKSSALNEGYANYFAYQISGLRNLAAHTKAHISKGYAPKRGKTKNRYTFNEDVSVNAARHSYTYSVLMDVDQALGVDGFLIVTKALEKMDEETRLKSEADGLEDCLIWAVRNVTPPGSKQDGQLLALRAALRIRGL